MWTLFLWNLFAVKALGAPHAATSTCFAPGSVCDGNTASDRSVWCEYNLQTDWYSEVPNTGVTVEYWFNITNTTSAPDGIERMILAVNGSVPGPAIDANWGDTVGMTNTKLPDGTMVLPFYQSGAVIHVTNSMQTNGTGIHWHGIRQLGTNWMDGVPSITQCPIAPGESMTYAWRATQYGSSWYHSHFSLQAWLGLFGPIIIHGPASANYDEDMGPILLSDWSHQTPYELYSYALTKGPPTQDNGLINGLNVYNCSGNFTGARWETTVTSGTSYRMRIVNTAINTHFKFTIDNHKLKVMAMDFVPIKPYETEYLNIAAGQRYNVVVTADQPEGDYWVRAIPQKICSLHANGDNIRGVLRYDNCSRADPTTTAYTAPPDECVDEPYASLVPVLAQNPTVLVKTNGSDMPVVGAFVNNLAKWYISNKTMAVQWESPTTLDVYNGGKNWTDNDHVVEVNTANQWVYFVLSTTLEVPHPFHLHGHDFFTLASGTGP